MKEFDTKAAVEMLVRAANRVALEESALCELDSVCGDGDHGTAAKGALAAAAEAAKSSGGSLKDLFFNAGMAAMSHSNGSTSTLFGSFLMGIGDGVEDGVSSLEAKGISKAFKSGLESVKANTSASVGDKTLMDALIPAVEAMDGAAGVEDLFARAAEAAKRGAESTKDLVAKFGRAKNLGEKSKGVCDAGAVTISLLFEEFAGVAKE